MSFWTYLANNAEANDWFNLEMQAHNYTLNIPALLALDWERSRVVVDVGGGTGQALISILQAHPHLKGILVDQPQVIDGARALVKSAGVETRCKLEPCDIFKSVPSGADTYILGHVLHSWDDEEAAAILKVIRQAIPAGGRLLLLERIVPAGNRRHLSKAADISMLLLFGSGRERTEREFIKLLQTANFRVTRVEKGRGAENVIEAMAD
jgi:SAM-dependent methyltransferase